MSVEISDNDTSSENHSIDFESFLSEIGFKTSLTEKTQQRVSYMALLYSHIIIQILNEKPINLKNVDDSLRNFKEQLEESKSKMDPMVRSELIEILSTADVGILLKQNFPMNYSKMKSFIVRHKDCKISLHLEQQRNSGIPEIVQTWNAMIFLVESHNLKLKKSAESSAPKKVNKEPVNLEKNHKRKRKPDSCEVNVDSRIHKSRPKSNHNEYEYLTEIKDVPISKLQYLMFCLTGKYRADIV